MLQLSTLLSSEAVKYPMISLLATLRIAENRIVAASRHGGSAWVEDLGIDLGDAVKWWGEGDSLDTEILDEARLDVEALLRGDETAVLDRDQIEGKAACRLYQALIDAQVETVTLDDPGFWRYVALAHVWNLVTWRQPAAFAVDHPEDGALEPKESFKKYVDGHNSRECLPTRMYLRVNALGGLDHAQLAWAVRGSTDFWRSHILRVKAGEHPPLVRAVVRRQADAATRLLTDPLRAFAKELNRTLTNLVPALLTDEAADELVGALWERQRAQVRLTTDDNATRTVASMQR